MITNSNPNPSATPTPAGTGTVVSTPAPSPLDLSGMGQPGAAAPAPPAPAAAPAPPAPENPDLARARAAFEASQAASQRAEQAAKPIVAPPPGPHARLAAMVSGLMTGLGAFGTSIATGGREGGVKEVEAVQTEEQRRQLAQQAEQREEQNQQVQHEMDTALAAQRLGQSWLLLGSTSTDLADKATREKMLQQQIQAGGLSLKDAAFESGLKTGDFSDYNKIVGNTGDAAKQAPQRAIDSWDNAIAGIKAGPYGNNPAIQTYIQAYSDPKATTAQRAAAVAGASNLVKNLDASAQSTEATGRAAQLAPPTPQQTQDAVSTVSSYAALDPGTRAGLIRSIKDAPTLAQQENILNRALSQSDLMIRRNANRSAAAASKLQLTIDSVNAQIDNDARILANPLVHGTPLYAQVEDNMNRLQRRLDILTGVTPAPLPSGRQNINLSHKVGDTITQHGHVYVVTAVDKNGKVLSAKPR